MAYKEYTHNNKVYREYEHTNQKTEQTVDIELVEGAMSIYVSEGFHDDGPSAGVNLSKEQTLEIIKMLTDSLDQVKD